ncbi:MAG: BREX-1 system adenine-specific DNA-methyltransferase PglX [Terrisporobacter sp.]|uniref:BREX-1 system adenine-specific DNA-methyltransferase PglX n=3 Tax=Terrisporobacter sp. TaxID=1965305 RepID=UPI0025F9DA80|nr:BREX-1 system adenine-specific DNA-methyltransferase PglX [uncultured Terrisporobacter sp.]
MDASVISRFNNEERKILDKSAIKDFATSARRKLIEGVSQKAYLIGISKDCIKEVDIIGDGVRIEINNETVYLTNKENEQRNKLIEQIEQKGYEQVMEEVAYTWFNRIIAIRFMEVNNYLPSEIRILSSEDGDKMEPDAVSQVNSIVDELNLNLDKVYKFQDDNDVNGLFKYIFVKQCNAFGKIMPVMFEKIEDYTELLLPDGLLLEGNVVNDLVNNIDEEDFKNQVEIIGWMYQYYISEKKDKVFADLKKNKKITKENIPAATQLFTPDWIVRYMVENSLGKLWLEGHPDEELQESFKYYLEEAKQESDVEKELEKIRKERSKLSPEDITVLDPAMGSGHILVYAFDVLYQIYVSAGYSERDIPRLILEKNLYGLDIDDRAGQLAYFALIMKARSYSRRLFRDMERNPIELNVCSIQESNGLTKADIEYFANGDDELKIDIEYLVNVFTDAKEYGSIIDVDSINLKKVNNRLLHIKEDTINLFMNNKRERIVNKIINLTKQWKIINNKYDICITNPPYMGNVGMNDIIKRYIEEQYKDTKSDLSTVFMERCFRYTTFDGFLAMVNMHSWMFLFTYEKFRNRILEKYTIDTLVHLGMEAFDNIIGKVVQTVAFVFRKKNIANYKTTNIRLVDFYDSRRHDKEKNYYNERYRYISKQSDFNEIPGHPIAYWVSKKFVDNFKVGISIESISEFTGSQNITANNEKYLRFLWEVGADSIGEGKNWVLYSKGGDYRKHYGNLEYIVNWSDNARKFYKNNKTSNLLGEKYWYKEGITYTMLSTKNTSFRYLPTGCIFDKGGPSINYIKNINYILALLNSCVVKKYLDVLNPTINIQAKDIKNIPIIIDKNYKFKVESIEKECLDISKYDWDSSETSLEFKTHPIIEFKSNNLENSFNDWMYFMENQFNQLKDNEEELNRIFIDIYDLQDELTPEVEDKDITIRKADRDREMKSFISYTVGCMMGRYSLDEEGLVYAGGEFDINKYKTFKVDEDAIIPITDNEYFKDDIVSKFVEFVKIVFGSETLEENLNYIADTECFKRKTNETSRECLRRYFLKGFMEDHLKVYQKRPIYWMFDSGKQNGFKALIYMHRYDENMVAKIRTDYLHRIQRTYESEIIRLEKDINSEVISTKEKTKAKKEKEKISKQIDECKTYDQVIAHVANQRISIDLDDGVKVNYNKFQGIEVLIGNGKKNLKANLLFKAQI